jgi:hypothetical protein
MEHDLEIVAAGRKIDLNPFAQSIVSSTLAGLLGALKGIDLGTEIRVVLKPKARLDTLLKRE